MTKKTKKKRISVSSAKAKSRRLQNWVAEKISEITGYPWGYDEVIAPREMGQSGVDIRLVGDARKLFPFSVEAKNQEKWSIPSWIKQAESNCYEDTDWLLVVKKNRKNPIVIMDAEVFFSLVSKVIDTNKEQKNDK